MTGNGDDVAKVVPVRHVGRWVGSLVVLLGIAMLGHTVFSKLPTAQRACSTVGGVKTCHRIQEWRFGWDVVGKYFTTRAIFDGLEVTLELTVLAMIIGIVLGVILAIMRLSQTRLLSGTAWTYTWFFRGTPVYVQILFWGFLPLLYPSLSLGIPFTHWTLWHFTTSTVISGFTAGVIALGLNESAYMSEIARSGLISVDEGQVEAAKSLGMSRAQTLRLVILPQAMRVIIPPTGNEVISMLKTTSLVIPLAITDLLGAVTNIYSATYQIMPMLIVASLWYLAVSTVLSIGQYYVERHFAKGALRTPPPTPIQRLRTDLRGVATKMRIR
ncbi:MAG: amino acid ABC transporter permease [Acidobacteriota bacterium]|nr:amino acid ABC transporter permease [Acidobacteriota bacterium]